MMLEWLGESEKAERMEAAVAAVIREGRVRTYDMGAGPPRWTWDGPSPPPSARAADGSRARG